MNTFGRWFFALWGLVVTGYAAPALWRGWRALQWPSAAGRVVAAGVRYHGARSGGYLPKVSYDYVVDGEALTGARLRFGGRTLRSERGARAALGGAEPGAAVSVYYDPRRPRRSVLRPGVAAGDLFWLAAGMIALAVSALG